MAIATEADRVLARAIESGAVPGVVALAADARGVRYEGAFGERTLGGCAPMTLDTVFWIASMTKAVTAVAAMQVVEQGVTALDEPVAARLPDLAAVPVLEGFDGDGAPRFRPQRSPITLRHLLTHTAGFGYSAWNADLLRLQERNGAPFRPLEAPLLFDPGERWEYGINIDWVGRLIEHLSGQSLDAYFRDRILEPLGMHDTGFVIRPEQRGRLAGRHQRQADGSLSVLEVGYPERIAFYNGGGGLYSTGADYLRFLRMLLGGGALDGARVLRPETVAEIGRNHIGELAVGTMRSVVPEASNDVELFRGMVKRWGLGGIITTADAPTGRAAGSWAWAGLANTYFWVDPARGVAGLLLTQILPFCDQDVLDLFEEFEHAVYRRS